MKLGRPFCSGRLGKPHPQETMRLEASEGVRPGWRCSQCHHYAPMIEEEPIDSRLWQEDLVCVLVSGEYADRLRVATGPLYLQLEPTDDPRICDLIVRDAA